MNKYNSDIKVSENMHRLPNGMLVHHLNKSETSFLYKEIFEKLTYTRHGIKLKDGAVVFDVGANIGMFTLFVKEKVKGAKVYSFEPIPEICGLLRLNTEQFGPDVVVHECGLSNEIKEAIFTYYPGYSILSGLYTDQSQDSRILLSGATRQWENTRKKPTEMSERAKEILIENALGSAVEHTCRLSTISDIIDKHGIERIDLLKIDVEKSEVDIMEGIVQEDWPKIEQIVLEVHDFDGGLCEKMDSLLKEKGFMTIVEQDEHFGSLYTPNIYARRT
ncbi:MAG: FkbM family methyltransferase [Nitrospirota bacterium]|nr:FkbM family methyltransferase [Nitrospirota bacterium]